MATTTRRSFIDMAAVRDLLDPPLLMAMEEIGTDSVARIVESISVPVEYLPDGRVVRSAPGEPPRTEEGVLRDNVDYAIERDEEGNRRLVITAARPPEPGDDADAAQILEFGGTGNWGFISRRPFMEPEYETLAAGEAADVIARHLSRHAKR